MYLFVWGCLYMLCRWTIILSRAGVTWMSWKEQRTWKLCIWSETPCRRIPSTGAKSCWPSPLYGRLMPRLFDSESPTALSRPPWRNVPDGFFLSTYHTPGLQYTALTEQLVNKKHWMADVVYNALTGFEMLLLLLNLNTRDFLVLASYLWGRFCLQMVATDWSHLEPLADFLFYDTLSG